jgi:LPXTG-motif cell wall-anchored protein
MTGPGATFLAILMIAAFALAAGGVYLLVKRRDRGKGLLMLLAAAVMLGNVLIWTL